uniref:hypothetical protein n=1 Tax=Actinomyces radicidentis TaxID=111015 RepID=UPI0026E0D0A2
PSPVSGAELSDLHGPLMLVGFLGTVIALKRAVAARAPWAFLAPLGSALGCLLLLAGVPAILGRAVVLAGALALCGIYVAVHRRAPSVAGDVESLGAIALALGDLQWLAAGTTGADAAQAVPTAVPLWLLFPVLTIVGERLELARVAFLGDGVEGTVRGLSVLALLAACLLPVTAAAHLLLGPALLALAVVMAYYDVARRTVRSTGGPRFMAASMLAGYVWLALAGVVWTLEGIDGGTGTAYEIVIHCLALGYAFSMILAHAPTIVPAIVHRRLPYHPLMWLPYALLHLSLAARVIGLTVGAVGPWQTGGALGVAAILVFLAIVVVSALAAGSIRRS